MLQMIHLALSLPDDLGAALEVRARDEGFAEIGDYLRALAEAELSADPAWHVTPDVETALAEGERSGYVPYDFQEIVAEARAKFRSR